MTDSEIELQHIALEIEAERWHNIHRFLFSYICHRDGYLTKHNRASWECARSNLPKSTQVVRLKDCTIEPVIPESDVVGAIKSTFREAPFSPYLLKALLDELLVYVVITKQQKNTLKATGLENNMPKSWYQEDISFSLQRFETADIRLTPNLNTNL